MEGSRLDRLMDLVGKKVFVILASGRKYSGTIKEIADAGIGRHFIYLEDKYSNTVIFVDTEANLIQQEA